MKPQEMSFAWYGWQKSIALLGLEELEPLVAAAFERGLTYPSVTDHGQFLEDLRLARTSGDVIASLRISTSRRSATPLRSCPSGMRSPRSTSARRRGVPP